MSSNINKIEKENNMAKNIMLFNNKIIEYLEFLNIIIDDKCFQKKITKFINKIYFGIVIDKFILLNLFKKNLYKYKINIIENDVKIITYIEEYLFEKKITISDKWDYINDENKKIWWKYLKIFVLLYEKIYDL